MLTPKLGRLETVPLRTIWENEGVHFTPWLALDENLRMLSDALQIELELEAQEKDVGPFRADILCKDTRDGSWVLIENQLEITDHKHLGQLMTYAAGLEAVTIVWIAARFTEEHRAAVDWLNQITGEKFNFFALEVELWKIADSPAAPKFNIVSKPNNWSSSVAAAASGISSEILSETKQLQLEFWTAFRAYLDTNSSSLNAPTPRPQHWANFSIGKANYCTYAICAVRDKWIGVGLACGGPLAKASYRELERQKAAVEAEIGDTLHWRELPERIESHVSLRKQFDPADRTEWPDQFEWLSTKLALYDRAFRQRVRAISTSEPTNSD